MHSSIQGFPGTRVLVAGDWPTMAELLGEIFSDLNAIVTVASSGSCAIDMVKRRRFDLAIVDLVMHPPDDWNLLQAMSIMDPTLLRSTIVLTGTPGPGQARRIENLGAHLVHKPFGLEPLRSLCHTILQTARRRAAG
jgi:CheY-like chemotaxis protein